jgi:hypothetical protein
MPQVFAKLQNLDLTLADLKRVAADGFGDKANTWLWSMAWYKGRPYVGTGRDHLRDAPDLRRPAGVEGLRHRGMGGGCPPETPARSIAAEIWRLDPPPANGSALQIARDHLPEVDDNDAPIYTARDIGFGHDGVHRGRGTEALYVGSVTSGSVYDQLPQFATTASRRPHSPDDRWQQLGTPSTACWHVPRDIGKPDLIANKTIRSIRDLAFYNGMLFAQAGTFTGPAASSPRPNRPPATTRGSAPPRASRTFLCGTSRCSRIAST